MNHFKRVKILYNMNYKENKWKFIMAALQADKKNI